MLTSLVAAALALSHASSRGAEPTLQDTRAAPGTAPGAALKTEQAPWEFSATALWSDPPGTDDRVTTIVYAERGALHLEARYGYEDDETASLFAGWTFAGGEELAASVTPMLGLVGGDTDGVAPGLEYDLGWRRIEWYAELEYLFDAHDRDDDFFYSWSTLTYGFNEWLSAGLVVERSKLVDTDWSLQRGLALEVQRGHLGLSLYAYDIGTDDSYAVLSLGFAP